MGQQGVQGFPTLKWGDASALEDYEGGRAFDDLEKFAEENLKPLCGPANMDLCDEEKKAEIQAFQALSEEELKEKVAAKEKEITDADELFTAEVEKLQQKYDEISGQKDEAIKAVRRQGSASCAPWRPRRPRRRRRPARRLR